VIVGIDVRETAARAALVDDQGSVVRRSERQGSPAAAAEDAVRTLNAPAGAHIGVAVRDPADPGAADIAAAAARAAGAQTAPRVVSKGSAVALAEQWCGAAQGAKHVVALTAGEYIHAGIAIDGRVFEGAHGGAGSAGWLALNPVERDDYRRLGCLEAEVGASGIVRRLVWRIKSGDSSRVSEIAGGDLSDITVRHIFDAARSGDGVAIAVVRDTARYLGMAIANLIAIVDPDVVVLGGLIADAGDLLIEPSRMEAVRRVPAAVAGVVRIVPGALGDDAAAVGAARAAITGR
jgi:glucokinase